MEAILISAYCDTLEKEDSLRNLVRKLDKWEKDIILVSHSIIPEDIIKSCKYYFYDEENEISNLGEFWNVIYSVESPMFPDEIGHVCTKDYVTGNVGSVVIPIARLLLFGLGISKQLGYKYVHYMEYDCDVTDISFINDNTKKLEEGYENLTYRYEINTGWYSGDFELLGCYQGFNLDFYSFDSLNYNKEKILNDYNEFSPVFEDFWKTYYLDSDLRGRKRNNFIINLDKEVSEANKSQVIKGFIADTIKGMNRAKPPVDIVPIRFRNNSFFLFLASKQVPQGPHFYEAEINDKIIRGQFQPQGTSFLPVGLEWDDLKYIKLSIDGEVISEYNLDNPDERRILHERNYLKLNKK